MNLAVGVSRRGGQRHGRLSLRPVMQPDSAFHGGEDSRTRDAVWWTIVPSDPCGDS
jgi:hypothetical protein